MLKQNSINISSPGSKHHGNFLHSFGSNMNNSTKLMKKKSQSIMKTDSVRIHPNQSSILSKDEILEMRKVQNEQGYLLDYVDILDEKVGNTINRQKSILKSKYANMQAQLERMRRNIEKLKIKMIQWEKDLEENEIIKMIKGDLLNYQVYTNVLSKKFEEIDEKIKKEQEKMATWKENIKLKKQTLTLVNHENIRLSSEIAHYRKGLNNLKIKSSNSKPILNYSEIKLANNNTINNESTVNMSEDITVLEDTERKMNEFQFNNPEPTDETGNDYLKLTDITLDESSKFREMKRKFNDILNENKSLQSEIRQKISNFTALKTNYDECLSLEEKNLIKIQKIVTNNTGLSSSLLFEIKKMKMIDSVPDIDNSRGRMTRSLVLNKERDVKTVVYETLRNLLVKNNQNKKKQDIQDFWIPWDVFKTFEPLQITAILSLRPEIKEKMFSELNEKQKYMSTILLKNRPFSSLLN